VRVFILILVIVIAGAGHYLVFDGSIPNKSSYELEINEVRRLARSAMGGLPTQVNVEILARNSAPIFALRAGGGLANTEMVRSVFQVETPKGHYVIETGMDEALAAEFGQAENFSNDVWLRTQQLMTESIGIMVTHEHPDHIGGLVRHANPQNVADKAILTNEQVLELPRYTKNRMPPISFTGFEPLALEKPHLVSPGIVMIPAPGHTPGSIIIYIVLENSREFLFIGDIAYTHSNVEDGVDRARFMRFLMHDPEDRDAVVNQLSALHQISQSEPGILIIPAHASLYIAQLINEDVIGGKFSFDAN